MGVDQRQWVLTRKRCLILLIAILILGSALRLCGLASRSLWYDEGSTLRVAEYVDKSLSFLRADHSNEPPLFPFLVHIWYALIRGVLGATPGSTACDYLLRLLPCILGIVGIPLTFLACRSILKDDGSALLAAFLFAISPFQVYYAQELRAYAAYVTVSLGALICLVKALEENKVWHWILLTVCLALSVYSHFFAVWNIAAINIYYAATFKTHRKLLPRWLLCQCAVLLLCAYAFVSAYYLNYILAHAEQHWFPQPGLKTVLITFKNFFAGYSPNRLAYGAITVVCAASLVLGLYSLRKRRRALLLVAILALFPIMGNLVLWRIKPYPYYLHRLMIFSSVPCYILVAVGIRALRKGAFSLVVAALVAGLTVPCLADHYSQRLHPQWHHRLGVRYKVQNREAAHYIAGQLAKGDFVGHSIHFTLLPFAYYLSAEQSALGFTDEERIGLIRGYPNVSAWENIGLLPVRIENATETARRFWYVQSWWEPSDPHPLVKQIRGWLDGHLIREERKPFDGVTVYLYGNDPELKAGTKTNQLADYGDRTVPHYLFPENDTGVSAGTEWRRRFLARSVDSPYEQPGLYGVQFDMVVAQGRELSIIGQQLNAEYLDEDGDGERETLSLTEIGALVWEEGTTRIDSVDYSVLAMDGDGEKAVLASFPLRASDDFTYRFVVKNATDVTRTVQCSVRESAHVIEAVAFSRSDPESDVWRPTLQYNFSPPPEFFNKLAMAARLTDESPGGDALYSDVRLNAGRYVIFVRMLEETQETNWSRASLRFSIHPTGHSSPKTDGRLVGTVRSSNPSGRNGWTWRRVGEFQCDGEPFRLTLAAYNDDNLPKAYFDLGSVMFVRAERSAPSSPLETERFEETVGPFEQKEYTISASLGEHQIKRIDIELFDAASKEFRNIFFHVRREG